MNFALQDRENHGYRGKGGLSPTKPREEDVVQLYLGRADESVGAT